MRARPHRVVKNFSTAQQYAANVQSGGMCVVLILELIAHLRPDLISMYLLSFAFAYSFQVASNTGQSRLSYAY